MKSNIKYFILLAVLFTGCNDDSMDKFPLTSISSETFWNTESDLVLYNSLFYEYAKSEELRLLAGGIGNVSQSRPTGSYTHDGMTDNDVSALQYDGRNTRIRAGLINSDNNPAGFGWNGHTFGFMRVINIGLANYDKAKTTEAVINKYKGEARLFRAWMVADKVSLYGDFPWFERELNIDSEELYAARTPRETVMTNVLEDLNFACTHLPDDWGDGNAPGRLNRWCALLVKSRICLFEGTWRKYHGGNNAETWLQAAADAAKEAIERGPYKLYSKGNPQRDYNAIFQMNDLTGVDEVMYWRRYMQGVIVNSWGIYTYLTCASKSMVEDYLCTDGLPVTLSSLYQGDETFEKVFENRDPRLRQTVLHPDDVDSYRYYNWNGNGVTAPQVTGMFTNASVTGYSVMKSYNRDQELRQHNGTTPGIILRFAEVLLNYAEAKAELGSLTQADLDMSINKLRDRVGMPHMNVNNIPVDPRYTGDGVSPLIVEIRRERRVELFAEGFRYDDLRRWKQGRKLTKKDYGIRWDQANRDRYDPNGSCQVSYEADPVTGIEYICPNKGGDFENPVFEDRHYLWPVPVYARSMNPALGQNPGW